MAALECMLCGEKTWKYGEFQNRIFLKCPNCQSLMRHPDFYLSPTEEKHRYELHNNNIEDPGYQEFVKPIVEQIEQDFKPKATGIDFGCGTGPVIANLLLKKAYQTTLFDPFFKTPRKA